MHFLIVSFHSIRNDINVQTVYLKAYYKRKIYLQWDNWLLSSTPSYVDQQSNHLYEKGKDFNQFWVLKTKTQRATNSNTHFFKAILNLRYTLKGEAKRLGNRLIK